MKIEETTKERTFTVEATEAELKLIKCCIGKVEYSKLPDFPRWQVDGVYNIISNVLL